MAFRSTEQHQHSAKALDAAMAAWNDMPVAFFEALETFFFYMEIISSFLRNDFTNDDKT